MFSTITPNFEISTDLLQLSFSQEKGLKQAQLRATPGEVVVRVASDLDFRTFTIQQWLRNIVAEALRWQCNCLISPRLQAMALRANLQFNRVVYKDIRSRWGSCSSLHNLNFSLWLLLLPSRFIDYVIAHELAHLTQLNHSTAFWAEVDRILEEKGKAKRLDKEMNEFVKILLQSKQR